MTNKSKPKKPMVVIRTFSAGVHIGNLESRKGKEVVLSSARRLWRWSGANTLHEVALKGVNPDSKISEMVSSITLTEAIEIIPVSAEAIKSLESRWP